MPFPPKKKKPDMALLLEAEPEPRDAMEDEDELAEGDDFSDMPEEEDPMAAEGEDPFAEEALDIDPEQAALAETLGFTEPDQQQALIDLIKLVTAPPSDMGTESSSSLPPLPESTY